MASEENFSPYSIIPLRSYGSKQELQGITDPSLDTPIPSVGIYSAKSYLKEFNPKLKEDQAPEQVPIESIKAIAKSEALARQNKLLPPDVIDYYLPGALVEGRWGDFGVNEVLVNNRTAPSKDWETVRAAREKAVEDAYKKKIIGKDDLKIFKNEGWLPASNRIPGFDKLDKLFYSEDLWSSRNVGQQVQNVRDTAYKLGFGDYQTDITKVPGGYTKMDVHYPRRDPILMERLATTPEELQKNANLKTVALVNKASEKDINNALDFWTAFNGRGIAKDEKGNVIASPEIYKKKLADAREVLNNPANKEFKRLYTDLVKGYMTGRIK